MKKLLQSLMLLCVFTLQNNRPDIGIEYNLVAGLPNIYITPISEKIGHTWQQGKVWEKHLIQKFYSLLKTHDDYFVAIDLGAQQAVSLY